MEPVSINGPKFSADRRRLRLSRESAAVQAKVSTSTIRRIEAGTGRVSRAIVQSVCDALGLQLQNYLADSEIPDLSGEWSVLYVEQETLYPPYIVEEYLVVQQNDRKISGTYVTNLSDHPQGMIEIRTYSLNGIVNDKFISGEYSRLPDDKEFPRGSGTFHLVFVRGHHWCEGFCTFYTDDGLLASSPNIWIHRNFSNYELALEQARVALTKHDYFRIAPFSRPK